MKSICVSISTFQHFRSKWEILKKSNYEGVDKGLIRVMNQLNDIPGVCCLRVSIARPAQKKMYNTLSLVCTEEGLQHVNSLFGKLRTATLLESNRPSDTDVLRKGENTPLKTKATMSIDIQSKALLGGSFCYPQINLIVYHNDKVNTTDNDVVRCINIIKQAVGETRGELKVVT